MSKLVKIKLVKTFWYSRVYYIYRLVISLLSGRYKIALNCGLALQREISVAYRLGNISLIEFYMFCVVPYSKQIGTQNWYFKLV